MMKPFSGSRDSGSSSSGGRGSSGRRRGSGGGGGGGGYGGGVRKFGIIPHISLFSPMNAFGLL